MHQVNIFPKKVNLPGSITKTYKVKPDRNKKIYKF